MAQFSVEIMPPTGSVLGGNQQDMQEPILHVHAKWPVALAVIGHPEPGDAISTHKESVPVFANVESPQNMWAAHVPVPFACTSFV
jgi:hypothetical protein